MNVAKLFAPKEIGDEVTTSVVRLKRRLMERLTRIARTESDGTGMHISRNDVIEKFLELACEQYERDEAEEAARMKADATETLRPKKPQK